MKRLSPAIARQHWQRASAVCFDVDSTVVTEEGIDVLAAFCGAGEAVAELTRQAMGGTVPFHVALAQRLALIQPTRAKLEQCIRQHPLELTPGMHRLTQRLQEKGKHVYLVSGGFRQMIAPAAHILGIPSSHIYANTLLFNPDGSFRGFDESEPTSRASGKAKVVGMLKEKHKYPIVVMVGDGATDLEARPPADAFVGFGGIVVRKAVEEGADWFVRDMQELIDALDESPR